MQDGASPIEMKGQLILLSLLNLFVWLILTQKCQKNAFRLKVHLRYIYVLETTLFIQLERCETGFDWLLARKEIKIGDLSMPSFK